MRKNYRPLTTFLFLGILVAGIVAAGIYYYEDQRARFRDKALHTLSDIADLKVEEMTLWRNERIGDAGTLYKNMAFSSLVRRFFERPDDLQLQRDIRSWISCIQITFGYDQVALHNAASDKWVLFSEQPEPISSATIQGVREAERSRRIDFHDFYQHEYSKKVYLSLLVPVLDDQGNDQAIGTVRLRIDPTALLFPMLQRWPTPSQTSEILLVRREGDRVVFLNELKFRKNTALELQLPLENMSIPAVRAALGRFGELEGVDYRGVPVLAVVREIRDSPWCLIAKVDAEEVYAPMRERFWTTVAFVVFLIAVVGLAARLLWRRQQVSFYCERLQAAERLQEVNAHLAITLKSIGDAVISTDLSGRVVQMNRVAESLTDWTMNEAAGRPLGDVFHTFNAQTRQRAADPVARVLAEGQITGLANHTVLIARDGVERQIADSAAPIRDADGHVRGVVLIFRDVTCEYAAAEALRESEERFRGFVENANDIVYSLSPDGVFTYVSPNWQQLLGQSPADVIGKSFEPFVHPEDIPICRNALERALKLDERFTVADYRVLHKDGSYRWHATKGAAMRDRDGRLTGIIGIARDITEQKQAEEMLKQHAAELAAHNEELKRFNVAATGRELRMIELKREVNDLCLQLGQPPRYSLQFADNVVPSGAELMPESQEVGTST